MTVTMMLHKWFGSHKPDLATSRWDRGHFAAQCEVCAIELTQLPGLPWRMKAISAK